MRAADVVNHLAGRNELFRGLRRTRLAGGPLLPSFVCAPISSDDPTFSGESLRHRRDLIPKSLLVVDTKQVRTQQKCSRLGEMRVIVDEAWNHEATLEVDDARRPADTWPDLGVGAHRHDPIAKNGYRPRSGAIGIDRIDRSVQKNEIGWRFLRRERRAQKPTESDQSENSKSWHEQLLFF